MRLGRRHVSAFLSQAAGKLTISNNPNFLVHQIGSSRQNYISKLNEASVYLGAIPITHLIIYLDTVSNEMKCDVANCRGLISAAFKNVELFLSQFHQPSWKSRSDRNLLLGHPCTFRTWYSKLFSELMGG